MRGIEKIIAYGRRRSRGTLKTIAQLVQLIVDIILIYKDEVSPIIIYHYTVL